MKMKYSFQESILNIPFYQLSFLTHLPKEPISFEKIIEYVPETWLESRTVVVLSSRGEWEKLNEKGILLRFIQDPNLIGVVLCSLETPALSEEVYKLFQEIAIPLICVGDSSAATILKGGNDFLSFSRLSLELKGFMEKGFVDLAGEMSKALRSPLLYLDEHDQLLWQTGENKDLQDGNRWLNTHYKKFNTASIEAVDSFLAYPIQISEEITHALVVSSLTESWQKKLMDKFIGLVALSIQTEERFQEQQELFKDHFVYDLLYHKFESQKVMIKQGKVWGWNLEKPHHLLLMNIAVSVGAEIHMNWMDEILLAMKEHISQMEEKIIIFPFQDQLVVLLEDGENRSISQRKKHVVEVALQLSKVTANISHCQCFIGIGKWYQDTTHLNKSYQEAKMALQFGAIWFEHKQVYHINDLGVLRLLIQIHQEILRDYKDEYLLPLIESDRESGTDYIKTLQVYIQQKGKINEVSDVLYVHPNTLRNRIKKIEELTGIDLQDPEEFMNLIVAVKILSFIHS